MLLQIAGEVWAETPPSLNGGGSRATEPAAPWHSRDFDFTVTRKGHRLPVPCSCRPSPDHLGRRALIRVLSERSDPIQKHRHSTATGFGQRGEGLIEADARLSRTRLVLGDGLDADLKFGWVTGSPD